MKTSIKALAINWIYLLVVMILGFIFVGIYILLDGNNFAGEASDTFYEYNLNEKKLLLQTEVHNRLDEIEYERNNLLNSEKEVLLQKIHDVYNLLRNSDVINEIDIDVRRELAVSIFENIVSNDKDYLYFVMDPSGALLRSGTDEGIVGVDLYNNRDVEGKYFVREIITAKKNKDGIYVDYYWPMEKDGEPFEKTSYCLYLPEFDFIIGTGVYHEDLQVELKNRIYERLQTYYEDKENYIFVTEYDSTARVSGNRNLIGKNMSELTSIDGESVHNAFMRIIETDGSGYHTYSFFEKDSDEYSEKISYIYDLKEWGVYIGMGFYMNDLNDELGNYSKLFKEHYYNQALYVIIGLMFIAIVVFAIYQRGAFLQKIFLKQGDIIFEKLFHLSDEAIIVISSNGKILYMNDITGRLFNHNIEHYIKAGRVELPLAEDGIHMIKAAEERIYYVTIRSEGVSYKAQDSILYFIDDVTVQYTKTHKLEKLALNDELTSLPNRRALIEDFDDQCYDMVADENLVIGLIDIDNFKIINDTHGHSTGDVVLKKLGETFKSRLRAEDSFYRYGGEEFVVILSNITLERGKHLLEELDEQFNHNIQQELGFECTYSCGLIMVDNNLENKELDSIIAEADKLMYKAKENGRNRTEI